MALDHLQEKGEAGQKTTSSRPPQLPTTKVLELQGRILLCQVLAWDGGVGGTRASLPPPTLTWATARVLGLCLPRITIILQECTEFFYNL